MKHFIRSTIALVCLATLSISYPSQRANAAANPSPTQARAPLPTFIVLNPIGTVSTGKPFQIQGRLLSKVESGDAPIAKRPMRLFVDNVFVDRIFTDAEGNISARIRTKIAPGKHVVYVFFDGTKGYVPATGFVEFQAIAGPSVAQANPRATARIAILSTPALVEAAEPFTVTAQLSSTAKSPLANEQLILSLGDAKVAATTEADGTAHFVVKRLLPAGELTGTVSYKGSKTFVRTAARFSLMAGPARVTEIKAIHLSAATIRVGEHVSYTVQLQDASSKPLAGRFIRFFLNDTLLQGATTDEQGQAVLKLASELNVGQHTLRATFFGKPGLTPSTLTQNLTVLANTLRVGTVPPIAGVALEVGGQAYQTDSRGEVQVLVTSAQPINVSLKTLNTTAPNMRAEFIRWNDGISSQDRLINPTNSMSYQIGFHISRPISAEVLSGSQQVNPVRVHEMVIVSDQGVPTSLAAGKTQWVVTSLIRRGEEGLEPWPVNYTLARLVVDNEVYPMNNKRRLKLATSGTVSTTVPFFRVQVVVKDALFGTPIGTKLQVLQPDGRVDEVAIDANGVAQLPELIRGNYSLQLLGAGALNTQMPTYLANEKTIDMLVVSYTDMGLVGGALAGLVGLLIVAGHLFARSTSRKPSPFSMSSR
jgi:Bacterial Ig-like domain (group 3)